MRYQMPFITIFAVILTLAWVPLVADAASKDKKEKFTGEFWNKGKHMQITGDAVPVGEDGIHDPTNDTAMVGLQPPVEAMKTFPRDSAGLLDWVKTLETGLIEPRSDMFGILPPAEPLNLDITFTNTGSMPNVVFPHRQHTEWLDCTNCHPDIFVQKKGANKFKMTDIFAGKYCGTCHGKIAFDTTRNCMRCHSAAPKKKK